MARPRIVLICGLLGWVFFTEPSLAAPSAKAPTGTWQLFKDSDGRTPVAGAIVEITFGAGTFKFKAVKPDETVTDDGTFQISGRQITVAFRDMETGRKSGPWSMSADTLVLPFKMLEDQPGFSTWMTPAALQAYLAKIPPRPAGPESMPALLTRLQKLVEAFNNGAQRQAIDQRAKSRAASYRGGEAEAYASQGTVYFLKGFYREAWYAFARAAVLKPNNAVYLTNLATTLQEIGPMRDARTLLEWVTRNYPNLDPPFGNLGSACLALKDAACARAAFARGQALAPKSGLFDYGMGKALAMQGKTADAQIAYRAAWSKGYSGSGKEGRR